MIEVLVDLALGLAESIIGTIVTLALCLVPSGMASLWNRCRAATVRWRSHRRASRLATIVEIELQALNAIHRINCDAWNAAQAMRAEDRIRRN